MCIFTHIDTYIHRYTCMYVYMLMYVCICSIYVFNLVSSLIYLINLNASISDFASTSCKIIADNILITPHFLLLVGACAHA